ncbi:hypothetical protein FHN55_14755 [Streptomyces sp. NP160]|uniref:hypothetical protein n=1 Tax=Streptomyces sp. NP160 TaxID=2586637 RepID=UPI00111B3DA3|nr:hypothetical protein [Streptomyces sp. NP160]TNM64089.1 hypothetical protein FHN55_14755 [Streptomyces sp. NP160]
MDTSKSKAGGTTPRRARLRVRLLDAMAEQTLVRIHRASDTTHRHEGYVVGVGSAWVLLAVLDPRIELDGWTALRLDDLLRVKRLGGPEAFPARALRRRGQWPSTAVPLDLDDDGELLRSAGRCAPLVTVHTDVLDASVCFIGEVVSVDDTTATLQTIDPDAVWEEHTDDWLLADITRVDVLGGYEGALALVALPRRGVG